MKDKIRIVNLATRNEDLTPYNIGEQNSMSNKWIDYGLNNDYPNYLRALYLSSPTNQAVIDGTINLSTGEGVEVINPEQNPLSNKYVNDNFPKDVVKSLLGDLKLYGWCVAQIYDGKLVKYSPVIKYRFDVKDKKTNKINFVWFSNDWDNYTQPQNRPSKLPIWYEGIDEPLSIMVTQLDKKGFDYYSPVDYTGGINYITLESEISKYHLSNIKNGLFPSFVVTFIGDEFSDEQMSQIESDVNKKFSGTNNSGRAVISFAANKDQATILETIEQPGLDNTYTFLSKECSEKILAGHGVNSPILFGLRDGSGLGNNAQEMEQSFYMFYESKLKHYQNYILNMITKIMNSNLLFGEVQFITYNPFNNTDKTQELSKYEKMSEMKAQKIVNKIENCKVSKPDDILIGENIFDGIVNETSVYQFVKSSNKNNMAIKKLEILSKQGYLFEKDAEIIKNTADYYFVEKKYIKKNK